MKTLILTLCAAALCLSGCGDGSVLRPEQASAEAYIEAAENPLCTIRITAGDAVLTGVLFDNETAREFAARLPLTVPLWEPAGFAKAFDLIAPLSEPEELAWDYAAGGLAYWHAGPSVTVFHGAYRGRTVVPIAPIGLISEDVGLFADYLDEIIIERVEEKDSRKE